ncbi:MAG: GDP-mannose 4,6-dehydratase [Candidatus Omnitrophota bacterium]
MKPEHRKSRFWNHKRILITGHEGFLGSWLAKALVEKGAKVVGVDKVKGRKDSILGGVRSSITGIKGDICDLSLIKRVFAKYKPQVVFHLAAEAIVGNANRSPLLAFESNIKGTWNVLEAARKSKFIESVIIASSDKAYGPHKKLPYTEEAPLKGNHPYDVSKSCTDLLAFTYYNTYQLPVCVTRCGNIYGGGDLNFSRLIPDAVVSILKKKRFTIRSDGKFIRDYVYVEDIVNGYLLIAEKAKKLNLFGEAFNLSDEKPYTVLGFFNKIVRVSGNKVPKPLILNKANHEIKKQYLCSKKARSVLGWKPQHSLEEGVRKTFQWYAKSSIQTVKI